VIALVVCWDVVCRFLFFLALVVLHEFGSDR